MYPSGGLDQARSANLADVRSRPSETNEGDRSRPEGPHVPVHFPDYLLLHDLFTVPLCSRSPDVHGDWRFLTASYSVLRLQILSPFVRCPAGPATRGDEHPRAQRPDELSNRYDHPHDQELAFKKPPTLCLGSSYLPNGPKAMNSLTGWLSSVLGGTSGAFP